MSVLLRRCTRHEASDTTLSTESTFAPGVLGVWRETLIPGKKNADPFREPAGWGRVSLLPWREVQLSYPCNGL